MGSSVLSESSYRVTRFTIATSVPYAEFETRFRDAVPRSLVVLSVLAACPEPWEKVATMTADAAPHGFLTYLEAPVDKLMHMAGHRKRTTSYLIGNHVVAEKMYRYNPAIMLYSPLRVVLWEDENGQAMLTFDHPVAQFSSFDDARITAVGVEINRKLAGLLTHLRLPVPDSLRGDEPLINDQGLATSSAPSQLLT